MDFSTKLGLVELHYKTLDTRINPLSNFTYSNSKKKNMDDKVQEGIDNKDYYSFLRKRNHPQIDPLNYKTEPIVIKHIVSIINFSRICIQPSSTKIHYLVKEYII